MTRKWFRKRKVKSCPSTWAQHHWSKALFICKLGTTWRWEIGFTLGHSAFGTHCIRRLGWPQNWSGFLGGEETFAFAGSRTRIVDSVASCLTDWAALSLELSRIYPYS
jgi:hypothetical protein